MFSDRKRGNEHRPEHRRFPLNFRKYFLTMQVMKHCHGLLGEVVEFPFLEVFKSTLFMVLGNLIFPSFLT